MKTENLNNNFPAQLLTHSTTFLFYMSILFFIIGFGFTDVMVGNWYQQFFPNLNGANIIDIQFTDSLTGYALTNLNSNGTAYVLKSTNGGDNWNIIYQQSTPQLTRFTKLQFLNRDTGFAGNY